MLLNKPKKINKFLVNYIDNAFMLYNLN